MTDDAVHVGVRVGEMHGDPYPGSIVRPCDACGSHIWIDPQTCAEIPTAHVHACMRCAQPADADTVGTTRGTLERVRQHLEAQAPYTPTRADVERLLLAIERAEGCTCDPATFEIETYDGPLRPDRDLTGLELLAHVEHRDGCPLAL